MRLRKGKMTQSPQYGESSQNQDLILIVEDEPMIRDFVQEILEFEGGFRTESVENADPLARSRARAAVTACCSMGISTPTP